MATIYWSGAIDTDIDDYRNYVTGENADPSSATIADNSGDFSGDNVIFQSLAVSNVSNNPTVNANETFNSIRIDSGSTLTGNASFSITVDGEADGAGTTTSGYAVDIAGALGSNVNLIITTAAHTFLDIVPSSGTVTNLTINHASCVAKWTGNSTLTGNLTINQGGIEADDGDETFTVNGDVTVGDGTGSANTAVLGNAADTAAMTFGSLTIASDGKYIATSGTPTIPSENGTKCFDNQDGGTFTHNNGTLKFASSIGDTTFDNAGADDFYNLTCETNGDCAYLNAITVLNNLTINNSNANFKANTDASGAITVHGITKLVDGIAFSTSDDNANADHYGFIVIEGGTFRISDTSSATKTCNGIRNIGGTLSG